MNFLNYKYLNIYIKKNKSNWLKSFIKKRIKYFK